MFSSLLLAECFNISMFISSLSVMLGMMSIVIVIQSSLSSSFEESILLTTSVLASLWFFISSNNLLWFVSLELASIPLLILLLIKGSQSEALDATFIFGLVTLGVSILLLLTLAFGLMNLSTSLILTMMCLLFLIKLPSMCVHGWLPMVHVESPTNGSVILAAVSLKLGCWGLIKTGISLWLILIALISCILMPLVALTQSDMKSLVAYSSVGHMGLFLVGLLALFSIPLLGAELMAVSHGWCSGGLFMMMGNAIHNMNSRSLNWISSCSSWMLSTYLLVNMSAPLTLNFISEVLITTFPSMTGLTWLMIILLMVCLTASFNLRLMMVTLTTHHISYPLILGICFMPNLFLLLILAFSLLEFMFCKYKVKAW